MADGTERVDADAVAPIKDLPSQPQQGVTELAQRLRENGAERRDAIAESRGDLGAHKAAGEAKAFDRAADEVEAFAALSDQPQQQGVVVSEEELEAQKRLRRSFATQRDEAHAKLARVYRWLTSKEAAKRALSVLDPDWPSFVSLMSRADMAQLQNTKDTLTAAVDAFIALDVEPQDTPAKFTLAEIREMLTLHDVVVAVARARWERLGRPETWDDLSFVRHSEGMLNARAEIDSVLAGLSAAASDCEPEQDPPARSAAQCHGCQRDFEEEGYETLPIDWSAPIIDGKCILGCPDHSPQPVGSGGEDGGEATVVMSVEQRERLREIAHWAEKRGMVTTHVGTKKLLEELTEVCPVCHGDNSGGGYDEPAYNCDHCESRTRIPRGRDSRLTKESVPSEFDQLRGEFLRWSEHHKQEGERAISESSRESHNAAGEAYDDALKSLDQVLAAFKQDSGEEAEEEKTERAKRLLDEFGKAVGADESEDVRVSSDGEEMRPRYFCRRCDQEVGPNHDAAGPGHDVEVSEVPVSSDGEVGS